MSDDGSGGPAIDTVKDLFADKYQIVERLDWNGLALVYRAEREGGESVAVAVLPINTAASPEVVTSFKGKAAELQLLVEPGIVRVSGHGVQHGVAYLELEFTDATTLADELQDGPLEQDQVLALTGELLEALGQGHAGGHFHWDLTPSNLLLAPGMDGSEHLSVVGFGFQEIIRAATSGTAAAKTGDGSGEQAERYLAPELGGAGAPDARADVYGVAALVHHMLTGSPPGPGSTAAPAAFADALAHGMAEDPEHRPADAATFGFTLAEAAAGRSGEKPSFAPPVGSMPAPFDPPAAAIPEITAAPEPAPPVAAAAPPPEAPPPTPEAPPPTPAPANVAAAPTLDPEPAALGLALPPESQVDAAEVAGDFAESDATVVDARALDEEALSPASAAEPSPEAAPAPAAPAAPAPPSPPGAPALETADYESLGPPPASGAGTGEAFAAAAMDATTEVSPPVAAAPAAPKVAAPDPFASAPAPAIQKSSGPARDPFAASPGGYHADSASQAPYAASDFVEREKKRGSFLVAIFVLLLAIGLAVTFFVIRAGASPPPELPGATSGSTATE